MQGAMAESANHRADSPPSHEPHHVFDHFPLALEEVPRDGPCLESSRRAARHSERRAAIAGRGHPARMPQSPADPCGPPWCPARHAPGARERAEGGRTPCGPGEWTFLASRELGAARRPGEPERRNPTGPRPPPCRAPPRRRSAGQVRPALQRRRGRPESTRPRRPPAPPPSTSRTPAGA